MQSSNEKAKPLEPSSEWGKFALGYGLLWVILIAGMDLGWGKLTSALALLIAGGAAVVYGPKALENLGLGGK